MLFNLLFIFNNEWFFYWILDFCVFVRRFYILHLSWVLLTSSGKALTSRSWSQGRHHQVRVKVQACLASVDALIGERSALLLQVQAESWGSSLGPGLNDAGIRAPCHCFSGGLPDSEISLDLPLRPCKDESPTWPSTHTCTGYRAHLVAE